ncbi:MAG: type VI secretion system baseplate subunit TssE [Campylobacter sp.]|nr:type VI secretion system baseplate subunit TssE [Campylobacter sp.]
MALSDRILHEVNKIPNSDPYRQNVVKDIKDNIDILLNSRLDRIGFLDSVNMPNFQDLNLSQNELCNNMAQGIYNTINKFERRARVENISCDNRLAPNQLTFFLSLAMNNDEFNQFDIKIVFLNNRFCEVIQC